eukprot:gene3902-15218_t
MALFIFQITKKRKLDNLVSAETLDGGKLRAAAIAKRDERILIQIEDKDCVALEVKYHRLCYKRDVSYHDFPSNKEQAAAWKVRIRRVGFEPSKYSYVCSKHFKKEDFTEPSKDTPTVYQKPRLKRGAIPSLFLHGERSVEVKSRSTATSLRALEPLKKSPKKKISC